MEDQKALAAVVALELEQANLRVTNAHDGGQGAALAREQRFDLILLDQKLPDMDGLELCRQLKSDTALQDIPVILFTAYPSFTQELEARRLGADYLLKGIPSSRLAARIISEVELARDRTSRASKNPHPKPDNGTQPPPSKR